MGNPDASTVEILHGHPEEFATRFFGPATPQVNVEFGGLSHPGKVRTNNEDHFAIVRRRRQRDLLLTNLPEGILPLVQDDAYVLTVADGVGGAAFGELASMMALRISWDLTTSAFKWHFKLTPEEIAEAMEHLRLYGERIHHRLQKEAYEHPRLAGMGTTLTAVLTAGLDGVVAHVGDLRAYLFRDGTLTQLTRDHTLAQQMVDTGLLASLEQATGFMRALLTNCLGGERSQVKVDTHELHLRDGDRLLLCTDGLSDLVSADEITQVLKGTAASQAACEALVDLALAHGGSDNVTMVLAKYRVLTAVEQK